MWFGNLKVDRSLTIVVVGGGAGGVELALSLDHRLEELRKELGRSIESKAKIRYAVHSKMEVWCKWLLPY